MKRHEAVGQIAVGRVGALAVALGVGFVMAGPSAVAWAAPSDSTTGATTDTAGQSASTSGSDEPQTDRTGLSDRPSAGQQTTGSDQETAESTLNRVGQPKHAPLGLAGQERRAARSPRAVHRTGSALARPSHVADESGPIEVQERSAFRTPSPHRIPAAGVASSPLVASTMAAIPEEETTSPTVAPPPAQPFSSAPPESGQYAQLSGTENDQVPAAAPAAWVVAAAARRELFSAAAAAPNRTPTIKKVTVGKPDPATGVVAGQITGADSDKDRLTYGVQGLSAKGATVSVDAVTGAFTYRPSYAIRHAAARWSATAADRSDTVTLTVSDGRGGLATRSVAVSIQPQDVAPKLTVTASVPDPRTGAVRVTMVATDPDGDQIGFFGAGHTDTGSYQFGEGISWSGNTYSSSFTYTPNAATRHAAAAVGAPASAKVVTLPVEVQDSHAGRTFGSVVVSILPLNLTPTVTGTSVANPNSKGVVTGKVVAIDGDTDKLTYSAASTAKGKVTVNAKAGTFTYTPTSAARHAAAAGSDTTDRVTISVNDAHGGSATVVVTVNILPKNTAPTFKVTVGKPNMATGVVTGKLTGSDADGDTLVYGLPTGTAKGNLTFDPGTRTFTFTPSTASRRAAGAPGAPKSAKVDTFAVTVVDGHGAVVTKTVTVSIAPPGPASAPVIEKVSVGQPDPISGVVGGSILASDANGDPLTYSLGSGPGKGSVSISADGSFSYTPTPAQRSTTTALTDSFTITVSDGVKAAIASVSVSVAPIPSQLVAGQRLTAGQYITSSGGRYNLVMQSDGNLVLYDTQSGGALWSSKTNGRTGVYATMQGDGNFVLYSGQTAVWSTGTNGNGGARLVVQGDANIVVYQGSTALWDRHAGRLNPGGGGSGGGGLSAKVAAFVQAFQGKVWGQARYGTRAYTNPASMTNNPSDPNYTPDMVGECVSLVTQFLKYAFNITPDAWGDAQEYRPGYKGGLKMAANGFQWRTDRNFQPGDILVFSSNHIGIYYNGQLFDANNTAGGRGANGIGGWAARHAGFGSIGAVAGYAGYWRRPS